MNYVYFRNLFVDNSRRASSERGRFARMSRLFAAPPTCDAVSALRLLAVGAGVPRQARLATEQHHPSGRTVIWVTDEERKRLVSIGAQPVTAAQAEALLSGERCERVLLPSQRQRRYPPMGGVA